MDIYNFINSRDVAAHCRKINKTWTSFEMAFIIGRSNRNMSEKHMAWHELMANYPDMPIPVNKNYKGFDEKYADGGVHKKLTEFMKYEEHMLKLFKTPESGAIYNYEIPEKAHLLYYGGNNAAAGGFISLEEAVGNMKSLYMRDEIIEIKIEKIFADDKGSIKGYTDYDGNLRDWLLYSDYFRRLYYDDYKYMINFNGAGYCFDIPLPFKRGDALIHRYYNPHGIDADNMFILDSIECKQTCDVCTEKNSVGLDIWGYNTDENGMLYKSRMNYYDYNHHDHLEYYRGEFTGKQ
jgi:hypothetical protein